MPSVRLVSTHGRFSLTQPNAPLSMSFPYSRFGATGGGTLRRIRPHPHPHSMTSVNSPNHLPIEASARSRSRTDSRPDFANHSAWSVPATRSRRCSGGYGKPTTSTTADEIWLIRVTSPVLSQANSVAHRYEITTDFFPVSQASHLYRH
jgi:hypothetical protein